MTFNSDLRDEKPKPKSKTEDEKKPAGERKLDEALKDTFPASDPVAAETPVTGSRARPPKPPR